MESFLALHPGTSNSIPNTLGLLQATCRLMTKAYLLTEHGLTIMAMYIMN